MAMPTINTKLKIEGEREYRQAISSCNDALAAMSSRLKLLQTTFAENENSVEGLSQVNEVLNEQILTQVEKVQTLQDAWEFARQEYGLADKSTLSFEQQLNKAKETLIEMERALRDNTEQLEAAGGKADNFSGGLEDLAEQTGTATEKTEELNEQVDKSNEKLTGLGTVIGDVTKAVGITLPESAKKSLNALAEIDKKSATLFISLASAAGAIVKAEQELADLTISSADSAASLTDLSYQTGLSTKELQELQYAAAYLGVDVNSITSAMDTLTQKMATAQNNVGETTEAFNKLNITVDDENGILRDSKDVFYEAIDALSRIENPTERNAVATEIFGQSWQKLKPLLSQGSEALREYAQEAHDVGYVMDTDMILKLEEVNKAQTRYTTGLEASKNQIAEEFAPALTAFIDKYGDTFSTLELDLKNSGTINLLGAILEIITALAPALEILGDLLVSAQPVIDTLGVGLSIVADALNIILSLAKGLTSLLNLDFSGAWDGLVDAADVLSGNSATKRYLSNMSSGSRGFFPITSAIKRFKSSEQEESQQGTWAPNVTGGYMGADGKWHQNAAGSENFIGGVTWVGENGPEPVWLPQGTRIGTNQEGRSLSGGDTYNFYVQANEIREIDDFIRRMKNQRRVARMGVT